MMLGMICETSRSQCRRSSVLNQCCAARSWIAFELVGQYGWLCLYFFEKSVGMSWMVP